MKIAWFYYVIWGSELKIHIEQGQIEELSLKAKRWAINNFPIMHNLKEECKLWIHLPLFETLYNHAFLGESIEGIAIIAISKPPSTYAFESTDISILFWIGMTMALQ